MEIVRADDLAIKKCINALNQKELIVYPTDTLYGLGADATSEEAVEKIFAAKRRPPDKPVSVAVHDIGQAQTMAHFNPLAIKIAQNFFPGPITILLNSKSPIKFLSKGGKIGIRIPDNPFTLKLLKHFGKPVVATSANISGGQDPKEITEIVNELLVHAKVVVDQGRTKYAVPSTIIDLSEGKIRLIREGALEISKIKEKIE